MVYYKAEYGGSFEAAQDKPDGLCVVAYFSKAISLLYIIRVFVTA